MTVVKINVRHDGVYQALNLTCYSYLRFYEDGSVIFTQHYLSAVHLADYLDKKNPIVLKSTYTSSGKDISCKFRTENSVEIEISCTDYSEMMYVEFKFLDNMKIQLYIFEFVYIAEMDNSLKIPYFYTYSDKKMVEVIPENLEKCLKNEPYVFHELFPPGLNLEKAPKIHVDIHVFKPTKNRDYFTLITSGIAEIAMNSPSIYTDMKYAELMIKLPSNWELPEPHEFKSKKLTDPESIWPIYRLREAPRILLEQNGFIVPNQMIYEEVISALTDDDDGGVWAPGTNFCGWIVSTPSREDYQLSRLKVGNKTVNIYTLIPVTLNELRFTLGDSPITLLQFFKIYGINDVIEVGRQCSATLIKFMLENYGTGKLPNFFDEHFALGNNLLIQGKSCAKRHEFKLSRKFTIQAGFSFVQKAIYQNSNEKLSMCRDKIIECLDFIEKLPKNL